MRFLYPYSILLIIPIITLYYFKFKHKITERFLLFSSIKHIKFKNSKLNYNFLYILEILGFLLLIMALMRPQFGVKEVKQSFRGYAIMIVLDNSSSMLAADLKPSRFKVAKKVIRDFVSKRGNDMLGLTIFAGEANTLIPITINHQMIIDTLSNLKMGVLKDGTAIGMGLISAISSLKESKAKTKIIILLTDGNNNMGDISPEEAARIAKEFNIKIYTIGIGSLNEAPYPMKTPFGIRYMRIRVDFNEDILKSIAKTTGGQYFRATDNKKMEKIFKDINNLEKNRFKITIRTKYYDKFYIPLILAFTFFILRYIIGKLFFLTD